MSVASPSRRAPAPPLSPYRILVYEPDHRGHRLSTVRTLVDALEPLRWRCGRPLEITVALSAEAPTSIEFAQQLEPVRDRFLDARVAPVAYGATPWQIAAGKGKALLALLRSRQVDHLYLPYGDGLVQWLGAARLRGATAPLSRVATEAVLMGTGFAHGDRHLATLSRLGALAVAPVDRLHLIDPVALERLDRYPARLRRRLTSMPDPTPAEPGRERGAARAALGLARDGRYFGCVGYQDERKGIPMLIDAFLAMPFDPTDRLLLAGRQSPAVRARLATVTDPRIIGLDRYLTEAELNDAVSALDLVVTPYAGFDGSASICIRAAGAPRRVLAGRTGWMGTIVPAFGLGRVCDVDDVGRLAEAMAGSIAEAVAYRSDTRQTPFCRYHQPPNLAAHWTSLIRQTLGLAPDDAWLPYPAFRRESR